MKGIAYFAIAAMIVALIGFFLTGCMRDPNDFKRTGYVDSNGNTAIPSALLNPGLDQCKTATGEIRRCDQAK